MKQGKRQVKMDIRSAVNYTEAQISHDSGAFFVDTDFGRICIDTNPFTEVNPVHPAVVTTWKNAPNTKFAVAKANETADYYCGLDIYGSVLSDHLTIIEGFTRCMFMSMGFTEDSIDESIIYAATYIFVDNYDPFSINVNMIEREFRKNHLKGISVKSNKAVQTLIREFFQSRLNGAERVHIKSTAVLSSYIDSHQNTQVFYDNYCKELFGLMLFAKKENDEESSRSSALIAEFRDGMETNKSVVSLKESI